MFVYKITNKVNGKIYVGITSRTVEERFKEHLRKGSLLHRAIKKYGEENFIVETLAEAFDENEMKWLEKKFIEKFNTMAPHGYNLTEGGEGTYGYKHSEESKKKMEKSWSEDRKAAKAEENRSRVWSEESKKKLSKAHNGKTISNEQKEKIIKKLSKPVICVETKISYPSIKMCAEAMGLKATHITRVLKGKRKTTGGYRFIYLEQEVNT